MTLLEKGSIEKLKWFSLKTFLKNERPHWELNPDPSLAVEYVIRGAVSCPLDHRGMTLFAGKPKS